MKCLIFIITLMFALSMESNIAKRCPHGMNLINGLCQLPCPRFCDHPKTENQCIDCLEEGYSKVIHGRGLGEDYWASFQLEPGAWHSWDGSNCWIYLKGIDSRDCESVGRKIFGDGRCHGFEETDYRSLTGRCWAKFKQDL